MNSGNLSLKAGNSVTLNPGFEVDKEENLQLVLLKKWHKRMKFRLLTLQIDCILIPQETIRYWDI